MEADELFLYQPPDLQWDVSEVARQVGGKARVIGTIAELVKEVVAVAHPGDHVLIMSNGAFGGIHMKLKEALQSS